MFSCKLLVFSVIVVRARVLLLTSVDTIFAVENLGLVVTGDEGIGVDVAGEHGQILGVGVVGHLSMSYLVS